MPIKELLLSRKFSYVYLLVLLFNIFFYIYHQANILPMLPMFLILAFMSVYSFFEIEKKKKIAQHL